MFFQALNILLIQPCLLKCSPGNILFIKSVRRNYLYLKDLVVHLLSQQVFAYSYTLHKHRFKNSYQSCKQPSFLVIINRKLNFFTSLFSRSLKTFQSLIRCGFVDKKIWFCLQESNNLLLKPCIFLCCQKSRILLHSLDFTAHLKSS